jgi:hypothetical protein
LKITKNVISISDFVIFRCFFKFLPTCI